MVRSDTLKDAFVFGRQMGSLCVFHYFAGPFLQGNRPNQHGLAGSTEYGAEPTPNCMVVAIFCAGNTFGV